MPVLYLKDLDDIINGINKLDNLSLVSIFQIPIVSKNEGISTPTDTCDTSERLRLLEQHQTMLDGIYEEQITRNLSTVEAIASEIDITMSQLEDNIDHLHPNDKRRLIVILEKNK